MIDVLRLRWRHGLAALLALFLLAPTPVPAPLVRALREASGAIRGGRSEAAIASFEAALALEPSLSSLHIPAARAALAADNPQAALAHLVAAERASLVEPDLPCLRGLALLRMGQPEAAIAIWSSSSEVCLANVTGLEHQETAYRLLEEAEGLLRTLQHLAQLEPEDPGVARRLGLVWVTSDPEQALPHLRRAASNHDPLSEELVGLILSNHADDRAYLLAQVGQALGRAGEWQLAAWAFRQALALRPNYHEARAYLGLALDRTGGNGTRELQAAAVGDPRSPLPHLFLALHYRLSGQPARSLRELTLAAELDSENPVVLAETASTQEALGDMEAAKAAYRAAAENARSDPTFWLLLAEFSLTHEIEVEEVALPAARNAAALQPSDSRAFSALGYAHFLLGHPILAERSLRRALSLDPLDARLQLRWGLLRQMQGDLPGAYAALTLASQLDPDGAIGEVARRTSEVLAPYVSARP